jgi:tight adherence protein C
MTVAERLAAFAPGVPPEALILGLLFAAVLMSVVGVLGVFRPTEPVERRLMQGIGDGRGEIVSVRGAGEDALVGGIGRLVTPADQSQLSSMRLELFRAGYRRPSSVRNYYGLRVVLGLGGAVAIALLYPLLSRQMATSSVLIATLLVGCIGYYGPWLWVARRAFVRARAIRDGFPDTLDMLLVSVEAGLSLDAALNRVALEIGPAHPVLAQELELVGLELRVGKGRIEVLHDMAMRIGVDEVHSFVTVLAQSDRFGTSIADALRVYAADMRAQRLVRAEEAANKLPFKLAIAVMTCTLPAVLVILAFPALIQLMSTLRNLRG